jgi:hypothetical protein
MTSKTVELAIFWLPLLAGVLLGGIAGSAWYGGDKIPAIWIAFFGILCFLLTGTLQLQQYVYANVLQPEIEIVAPSERSIVTWDAPRSFFLQSKAENDTTTSQFESKTPIIIFENKSSVIGQDASIDWDLAPFDMQAVLNSSSRLKAYEVIVNGDTVTLGPKPPITTPVGVPNQYRIIFKQKVPPVAFLGRRVESWIPNEVWQQVMLYFLATVPDMIGEKSPPLTLNAAARWNIPEGNKVANFKVNVIATNANTPNVQMPTLKFYVSVTAEKLPS